MNLLRQYAARILITCLAVITFTGCDNDSKLEEKNSPPPQTSPNQLHSLYSSRSISSAITHQCSTRGGVEIATGFDANQNQLLDPDEISQSYIVCHGLDAEPNHLTISQAPATPQQCPNGGTILHVGVELIPICYSSHQTSTAGYDNVKSMVRGFKHWITEIEQLPQQLNTASKQFNSAAALQRQGAKELIDSSAVIALALKTIHSLADGDYLASDLVTLNNQQGFLSISGTLKKSGLSITSDEIKLTNANNEIIVIQFDTIRLPPVQESSFDFSIFKFQAHSKNSSLYPVDISASYTSEVETRIDSIPKKLHGKISLALGSPSQPLRLITHSIDPIKFTGFLNTSLIAYPSDIPYFYNKKNNHFNIQTLQLDGELSQQGKIFSLKTSINTPNAETYRHQTPEKLLQQLSIAERYKLELSSHSSIGEWQYNTRYGYFSRNSYQHYELKSHFEQHKVTLKTIEEDWDNNGIANAVSYETYSTDIDGYRSHTWQHFNLTEAQSWLKNSLTAGWIDSNTKGEIIAYNWYWKENSLNNERYIDYYVETNYGRQGLQLPEAGKSIHYDARIIKAYVDDYTPVHSFANHMQYNIAIDIGLHDIHTSDKKTHLRFFADRYGYSPELGSLKISISYKEKSFTAHLPNPITNPFETWTPVDTSTPSFSFTDNQGGLIYFNQIDQNCYPHDESACPKLSANIYYQGLSYGTVYRDNNGDWIVYYNDNTEALLYDAPNI